jgi:hypothetical protein
MMGATLLKAAYNMQFFGHTKSFMPSLLEAMDTFQVQDFYLVDPQSYSVDNR